MKEQELPQPENNTSSDPRRKVIQLGLASSSLSCKQEGYPGVFQNVSAYIPWILHNIHQ